MHPIILLGPQGAEPNLHDALQRLGVDGPVCAVTAGWRELEGEVDGLDAVPAGQLTDLDIYLRVEEMFAKNSGLFDAHRERQSDLRELQRIYRRRLRYVLASVTDLMEHDDGSASVQLHLRAAINEVRALDRFHLRQINRVHQSFVPRLALSAHPRLAAEHERIAREIARSHAVLIAGGHVAVLLSRMRLVGLGPLLEARPLIAWSAGAMVLSERIVLYHDYTPDGAHDPEVMDTGLSLLPGVVPLPDAGRRLNIGDAPHLARVARRFSPQVCALLDPGTLLEYREGRLVESVHGRYLSRNGRVRTQRVKA